MSVQCTQCMLRSMQALMPLLCCAVIKMNFENHPNTKVVESWWQLANIFAFEKTGKTLKTLLKSDRRFRRYSFFQDSHDLGWLPLANERFWPKNHFSSFSTLFPPKLISGHPLTTLWWNLSKIRTPGLLGKLMMMAMLGIWKLESHHFDHLTFLIRLKLQYQMMTGHAQHNNHWGGPSVMWWNFPKILGEPGPPRTPRVAHPLLNCAHRKIQ